MTSDAEWMDKALRIAEQAAAAGEVPVAAIITGADGELISAAGNEIVLLHDPTAHAEMQAMRAAAKQLGNERLIGTTLYVTLEPCAMCVGANSLARIKRVVYAAQDPNGGAVLHGPRFFEQPTCHHRPEITHLAGETEAKSAELLRSFFRARR